MSPSLVVSMAFVSHSLVPSVLRVTFTVSICAALYLPLISPVSFISILMPLREMSLIVLVTVFPFNS